MYVVGVYVVGLGVSVGMYVEEMAVVGSAVEDGVGVVDSAHFLTVVLVPGRVTIMTGPSSGMLSIVSYITTENNVVEVHSLFVVSTVDVKITTTRF